MMEDFNKRLNGVFRLLGVILIFELAALLFNSAVVPGLSKRADNLKVFATAERDDATILPGDIYDRNGEELLKTYNETVLETEKTEDGEKKTKKVVRMVEYSDGKAYSQLIGYTGKRNLNLLAESEDQVINGRNDYRLLGFLDYAPYWKDKGNAGIYKTTNIDGRKGQGVELTIDDALQRKVYDTLRQEMNDETSIGSAVVLDVKTGEVLSMVSFPSYDFNDLQSAKEKMVTDGEYLESWFPVSYKNSETPGSIFKILMSVALIDNGKENLKVKDEPFVVDTEDGNTWTCKNSYSWVDGKINYKKALERSSNVFFATAALELGAEKFQKTASKFGLKPNDYQYADADQDGVNDFYVDNNKDGVDDNFVDKNKDGVCDDSQNISLDFGTVPYHWDLNVDDAVLAQTGFGQGKTELTTIHAAMIVQAIANDGEMLKPYMVKRIFDADGKTVYEGKTEVYSKATKKSTANKVTEAMQLSAMYGTKGTAAALFEKYQVAGKTGTAQTGDKQRPNNAWFVSFAPADDPQYVVVANHCKVQKSGAQLKETVAEIYRYLFESYQNSN